MTENDSTYKYRSDQRYFMFAEQVPSMISSTGSSDNVTNQVGREIVSGIYAPQERLPNEAMMLKRYSVSRTALREAYSKLAAKGLIIARPKVGTSVCARESWNMLDRDVLSWHIQTMPAEEIARELYALRRMVEPGAAALAAKLHTDSEVVAIQTAYEDMKNTSGNERELIEADLRFHVAILTATHNPFIGAFSSLIHAAMVSSFKLSWRGAEVAVIKEARLLQHGDVLEAIRDRNAVEAKLRMEQLLDESIRDVQKSFGTSN